MIIREFLAGDVAWVKTFADTAIGEGYYSEAELTEIQKQSIANTGQICSFLLVDENSYKVMGFRLAYPPGNWDHGKGQKLRPDLWPTPLAETAYFQSLFVSPELQGQGWGPRLAEKSLNVFKYLGAKGVVAHSWKESPHNSSFRYLKDLGFNEVIEHPLYWFNVQYKCTRDGYPCRCTAIEMHLKL
jgi:ribosomal protein S18 acetylase RimI-like enzyme